MSVTEDQLLAQIAAAPEDPAPRAVYRDWLADRGDPRGTGGRSRGPLPDLPGTARGLSGKKAWLGALAAIADPRRCRFVDGVLEALALRGDPGEPSQALEDPRLATVQVLELAQGSAGRAVWTRARLPSLRRVGGPVSELVALGTGGPPQALERVRLLFTTEAEWGTGPPTAALPPARELLLGFSPATGAGFATHAAVEHLQREADAEWRFGSGREQPPRPFRLTPAFAESLEPALAGVIARRRYAALGVEVEDATVEGIAAWLRLSAARGGEYFVVHAQNLIRLDADQRSLEVVPWQQGKAMERRLLLVSMLLRELSDLPLREVELDGPHRLPTSFRGKNSLLLECRRRGDVTSLRIGGTQVLP